MQTEITLEGTFSHAGIAGDPVVVLTVFDEGPFEAWCKDNGVFTQIMRHVDPTSGNDRAAIYVAESEVREINDGTTVRITIDVRVEKRGNGIKVLGIVRS
jgi:hypothetical protein